MNNKLAKISGGITILTSYLYLALPAIAATGDKLNPCPDQGKVGYLAPGCGDTFSLGTTIGSAIGVAFFLAFILTLVYLVWGGIRWIMSQGDKEGTKGAKDTVTSALIGIAVVVGSYILVNIAMQFLLGTNLNQLKLPTLDTVGKP